MAALASRASAADVLPPAHTSADCPANAPMVLGLVDCIRLAYDKQPALAAFRASVANAEARLRAVEKLRLLSVVARDLTLRRKQAELGVAAAHAQLEQAEWDIRYGVIRNYISYLYASEQADVVDFNLPLLQRVLDTAKQVEETGSRKDVDSRDIVDAEVSLRMVEARKHEAVQGAERAMAALREAIGIGPECCLQLVRVPLTMPDREICLDQIVSLAVTRRGEVRKTSAASEVASIEIKTQASSFLLSVQTFAAASDVHADPVPYGILDGEYRPSAVGLEMPPLLFGCRKDRIRQAQALADRAAAIMEKTRNLIALEAEDTYFRWKEAQNKRAPLRLATDLAEKRAKVDQGKFDIAKTGTRPTVADLVKERSEAITQRVQLNQANYVYLLTLVALERVTAGGFCAGFEELPPEPANGKP